VKHLFLLIPFLASLLAAGCGHHHDDDTNPVVQTSTDALVELNSWRAKKALPAVTLDLGLTSRCDTWVHAMAGSEGAIHDPAVKGTDERESVYQALDGDTTPAASLAVWDLSPLDHPSLFDQLSLPTAVLGGYAQYGADACLRLCPSPHDPRICNG
jgi:hypothetical protein